MAVLKNRFQLDLHRLEQKQNINEMLCKLKINVTLNLNYTEKNTCVSLHLSKESDW